ncbi:uncharacterized protein LOC135944294 isoform X1 [Cloeon dipterum]|uniref:uncharacterized protein LOC135944294 isoform X1 n=1 Tax=Cloeon dipterum TaxID=197152 RepID=UPI00322068B4
MWLSLALFCCALLLPPPALAGCVPKRMGFMSETTSKAPCPPGFYPDPEGKGCRLLLLKNTTPKTQQAPSPKPELEDHIINVPTKCPDGHQLDYRGKCRPKVSG